MHGKRTCREQNKARANLFARLATSWTLVPACPSSTCLPAAPADRHATARYRHELSGVTARTRIARCLFRAVAFYALVYHRVGTWLAIQRLGWLRVKKTQASELYRFLKRHRRQTHEQQLIKCFQYDIFMVHACKLETSPLSKCFLVHACKQSADPGSGRVEALCFLVVLFSLCTTKCTRAGLFV